jgi:probable phosphoglycerate mutase
VAERIAPVGDRVAADYASPLERTKETAAPIAAALGRKVQTERGLLEADFGEWTGSELKKLMKLPEWRAVQHRPSTFTFPGGESFAAMQLRIWDTVQRLAVAHPGKVVVAVSHADPIKAAVAQAMGCHLDLFQRIVVSPCSVTAVSSGGGGPMVLCVNSTGRDLSTLAPS